MMRSMRLLWALLGLGLAGLSAHAAGGHHAVDDASVLEAGKCKLEGWTEREAGNARALHHIAAGCRVGPVELSVNVDREHQTGMDANSSVSPQLKWAYALNDALSIGAVASGKFGSQSPRYVGSTLVLPLSWRIHNNLSAHVNWGRNFVRGSASQPRGGASLEWTPSSNVSLVAERFREADYNATRLGVRYVLTPDIKLDLSRARSLHAGGAIGWIAGVTWEFDKSFNP